MLQYCVKGPLRSSGPGFTGRTKEMNSDHVRQLVADIKNGVISRDEALCKVVVEVSKGRVNHAQGCLRPLLEVIPAHLGGEQAVIDVQEVKIEVQEAIIEDK